MTKIKDSWSEQKARFKKQFAILTGSAQVIEGDKRNQLSAKHQIRVDQARAQMRRIIGD